MENDFNNTEIAEDMSIFSFYEGVKTTSINPPDFVRFTFLSITLPFPSQPYGYLHHMHVTDCARGF